MNATTSERKLLDEIEPYVLSSASTLITCCYQNNFLAIELLSRPQVSHGTAHSGVVAFEVPEWFPVEEALLSADNGQLHSMVKHLALKRVVGTGQPGMRVHRIKLGPDLCADGETVALTYSPWFRFAAPPYRFDVENRVAAYVVAALGHLARVKGQRVRLELNPDRSVLWISERLRIEAMGAARLTEIAVLLDDDETSLSLASLQLSVARRMFPDVYAAVRSAGKAGERFRDASLLIEEDQVLLYGDRKAGDVQA